MHLCRGVYEWMSDDLCWVVHRRATVSHPIRFASFFFFAPLTCRVQKVYTFALASSFPLLRFIRHEHQTSIFPAPNSQNKSDKSSASELFQSVQRLMAAGSTKGTPHFTTYACTSPSHLYASTPQSSHCRTRT